MAKGQGITHGQHAFATVPGVEMERSVFNRSCGVKTTFDSGQLVPIFVDEALPGDTFSMNMTLFARIATLLRPIMDNVYMDVFFFAVPNRLLWDNWEKFNGAQTDPGDSTTFVIPTVTTLAGGYQENEVGDYLGLPTHIGSMEHSALFQRAYNLIWNEWFRDENLQDSAIKNVDDGPDSQLDYPLRKRGKRHDYFTSCLPFAQKGDAITLPLGTSAPLLGTVDVTGKVAAPTWDIGGATGLHLESTTSPFNATWDGSPGTGVDATWNTPNLEADLSAGGTADLTMATAATINAIRQAFQLQRLAERDARGGTRYTEILRSHFHVFSPDQRLQRPEYLGGGSTPVMLTPVARTGGTPAAELAAFGIAANGGVGFIKSFTEHCIILGLVASRADLNYQQGLDRQFSRSTRFDFFWPALAHIGEQAVKNKEIKAVDLAPPSDELTFGFQERWAEYRYKPSKITGLFRSNAAGTLELWHLAQNFTTITVPLDNDFIEEDPPFSRIVAVPSEPDFLFDAFFDFKCARPIPTYSVPGMIDHF